MGLLLSVGGEATTAEDFEFSNVDPGGLESCTFDLPGGRIPQPGDPVRVTDGGTTVWEGNVEAPGERQVEGRSSGSGQAVGPSALLDDQPLSMLWVSRSLAGFHEASVQRRLSLAGTYIFGADNSVEVLRDDLTGHPALVLKYTQIEVSAGRIPICETWFDAGPGNAIAQVKATYRTLENGAIGGLNAAWNITCLLANQDDANGANTGVTLNTAGGTLNLTTTATERRYLLFFFFFPNVIARTTGGWQVMIEDLRIYGTHGVPVNTDAQGTEGLLAGDIAREVLKRSGAPIRAGTIETTSPVINHLVMKDPVNPSAHLNALSTLAACHWGVWPGTMLDDQPVMDFTRRPEQPTVVVRRAECDDLEIEERVSSMFDSLEVRFEDPSSGPGLVTVTKTHPRMPAGRSHRKTVNIGTATLASATVTAQFLLGLDQAQSRGSGPVKLPGMVSTANGGRRPAHMLQAGRDRLKVLDMRFGGPLLEAGGPDTFRIRRVNVSVKAGVPSTTVEIDQGADLVETLNARLAELEAALSG